MLDKLRYDIVASISHFQARPPDTGAAVTTAGATGVAGAGVAAACGSWLKAPLL